MKGSSRQGNGVLVTGCSSGIGRAIAIALAQAGFTVYATVRKEADAESLRALGEPGLVPLFPLDLTRLADIAPIVDAVAADLRSRGKKGLYALINNAGGGSVAPIELLDLEELSRELMARIVGAVALVQAFLPSIRAAAGRLVWIATPAAIPTPYVASIHACDFAANCIARTLDIELKRWAVPSLQVRCGGIRTPAGLRTTAQVEAVLRGPGAELYAEALRKWGREMAAFDAKRAEPEKVAAVVLEALRAARPKRRYSVGHMARAAAILEALPQPLADAVLKGRF